MPVIGDLVFRLSCLPEIFENHGFVGARAESLTHGEEDHGQGIESILWEEVEDDKRDDVGQEGEDHGAPPAIGIGNNPRGNLQDIRSQFTNRYKGTDLQKGESHFPEKQDNERIEKTEIL